MSLFKYEYVDPNEFNVTAKPAPGEYEFTIDKVFTTDKDGYPLVSKNNSPKIRIALSLRFGKTSSSIIDDLVAQASTAWKIKQFADGVGMPSMYSQRGSFDTDRLVGLRGRCIIKNRQWTGNDGVVRDSLEVEYIPALVDGPEVEGDPDDEIPF